MVKIAGGSGVRPENVTPKLADALSVAFGGEPTRGAAGLPPTDLAGTPHARPRPVAEKSSPMPAASPIPPASALPAASPIPPSTPAPTRERVQLTSFRQLSFKVLGRRHGGMGRVEA